MHEKHIDEIINCLSPILNKLCKYELVFQKENGNRIIFKQYIGNYDRTNYIKQLEEVLYNNKKICFIKKNTIRSNKDYCLKIKNIDKTIEIKLKPSNIEISNPHELLTSAFIYCDIPEEIDKKVLDILIVKAKNIITSKKILNYKNKDVDSFYYSYDAICQAISSARSIKEYLDKIKTSPKVVYVTSGDAYKKNIDIQHLNIKSDLMHNYNASDIIIHTTNNKYVGVSLKRKKYHSTSDPTLINKNLVDFVECPILQEKLNEYFKNMLDELDEEYDESDIKKSISNIPVDIINEKIKTDEHSLWYDVRNIISKRQKRLIPKILNMVLKLDLAKIKNFDYIVCCGIGRYCEKNGPVIEDAELFKLKNIIKLYNNIIENSKLSIVRNKSSEDKNHASMFLHLCMDKIPIMDLQIRYKGDFHYSPTLMVTMTKEFKNMINKSR